MIVIGIDPGIAITGMAIVSFEKGIASLLHAHAITTHASAILPIRLESLFDELTFEIGKWKPDVAALENLFFNTNAKTALIVGQARGVVQLALQQANIPITEYTPPQVKMSLTGYGHADKKQIQQMVKLQFHLPKILTPDDVADAAAIALTHCFSYKMSPHLKY